MDKWITYIMAIVAGLIIAVAIFTLTEWIANTGIGTDLTNSIQDFFTNKIPASF